MSYPHTLIESIARVCHEVNRAYCASLGDNSQLPWAEAAQWQRESACNGVRYALSTPGATPENMHESWLAEKRAAGWKYGAYKDADAKIHPCFVPYGELPAEQRTKDYLFQAVVKAMR